MGQNLVSNHFTDEQWAAIDQTIAQLEAQFAPLLLSLGPAGRRRLVRMGDGSEAFCRKALDVMTKNATLMPQNLDLAEMRRDLDTHDALDARLARLTQLLEKGRDTDTALGSDAMASALEGYAFLKIAGKDAGLNELRRDLGKRFEAQGQRRERPASEPA